MPRPKKISPDPAPEAPAKPKAKTIRIAIPPEAAKPADPKYKRWFFIACAGGLVILVLAVIVIIMISRKKRPVTFKPIDNTEYIKNIEKLTRQGIEVDQETSRTILEKLDNIEKKKSVIIYESQENQQRIDRYNTNDIQRAFSELEHQP